MHSCFRTYLKSHTLINPPSLHTKHQSSAFSSFLLLFFFPIFFLNKIQEENHNFNRASNSTLLIRSCLQQLCQMQLEKTKIRENTKDPFARKNQTEQNYRAQTLHYSKTLRKKTEREILNRRTVTMLVKVSIFEREDNNVV